MSGVQMFFFLRFFFSEKMNKIKNKGGLKTHQQYK